MKIPSLSGVEHRHVRAGGVSLHVAQAGQGEPLLLLHGWPQHWWCWRYLIPRLAEDRRVLAVDLRGWGWSDAPPGAYAKATFAHDLLALLDAEALPSVDIIAHDWGGYSAFLLALEHPDRVRRMVALDIPPPWAGGAPRLNSAFPALLSYQALLATPVLGPAMMTRGTFFIRSMIRAGSAKRKRWTDEELDVYANVLRAPKRARATSACYRTFLTRELPASLRDGYRPSDLTTPTLLLMGSESILTRALDPQSAGVLRRETIEGAGHFLAEEAPEAVFELACAFLTGSG